MKNRTVRTAAIALALCLFFFGTSLPAQAADGRKTFVLVHGTWVGEWYWDPVVAELRKDGHVVHAVTLKGHGKRASENGPDVTLNDHINDIVRVIESNRLSNVYLVGHSYGGRPVTGAWDRARARIGHVIYVDAIAPAGDGTTPIPEDTEILTAIKRRFRTIAESGMLPVRKGMRQSLKSRSRPQSIKTLYAAVHLKNGPLPSDIPRTYIVATASRSPYFRNIADRLRKDSRWAVLEIDTGHDILKDGPAKLIDLLQTMN